MLFLPNEADFSTASTQNGPRIGIRNRLVRAASWARVEQRAHLDSREDLMRQHLDAKPNRWGQ